MERYERNKIFTTEDMMKLSKAKVCVIGCGGLGGYVIEMLARVGIGEIKAVDGDVFEASNLNRQILSRVNNIKKSKVEEAYNRVILINENVHFIPLQQFVDKDNVDEVIEGYDVVVDALDKISIRFVLAEACNRKKIPMIYGAIAGWYGQVSTILPGDNNLDFLYPDYQDKGIIRGVEEAIGNPSFTPATIASIQVSECLKLLTDKGELLRHSIMYIDLLDNEMMVIPLKQS